VKDVRKFHDGIALVASKVRGAEEDDEMVDDIAGFMEDVKGELPEVLTDEHLTSATIILDALLVQKGRTAKTM
jgi:hypothetical protein